MLKLVDISAIQDILNIILYPSFIWYFGYSGYWMLLVCLEVVDILYASILSELDVQKELLGKIMTLKLAYFGHIMRGSGSPLTLQIVEGMVEGKRKRGRQKKQWFDNIREWTGLSYMRAKRSAQNRSAWRRTIKKCAEGGRQSSGVTAAAR